MITKSEVYKRVVNYLNYTIQYNDMCKIMEELDIPYTTSSAPIKTKNGEVIQKQTYLYAETCVYRIATAYIHKLKKQNKVINIKEIMQKYSLKRDQINGVIRRKRIPHTVIGDKKNRETCIIGKNIKRLIDYIETDYKPYNIGEQLEINEQPNLENTLKSIEVYEKVKKIFEERNEFEEKYKKVQKEIESYKANEIAYKEIINNLKTKVNELEEEKKTKKKTSIIGKIVSLVR